MDPTLKDILIHFVQAFQADDESLSYDSSERNTAKIERFHHQFPLQDISSRFCHNLTNEEAKK